MRIIHVVIRRDEDAQGHVTESVVGTTEDDAEIGLIVDIDQEKIDWNATYRLEHYDEKGRKVNG